MSQMMVKFYNRLPEWAQMTWTVLVVSAIYVVVGEMTGIGG